MPSDNAQDDRGRDRSADDYRQEVEELKEALVASRTIGAAVGIVMAGSRMTYDAAFEHLVTLSQHTNRKVRELAERIVLTGEVPGDDPG